MSDANGNGKRPNPLDHIPPEMAASAARGLQPIPDTSPEGLAYAEVQAGLRCAGCGERIHRGFEFKALEVLRAPMDFAGKGQRMVGIKTLFSCARPDCDYALQCGREATAVRKIDNEWLFLDDERLAGMFNAPDEN